MINIFRKTYGLIKQRSSYALFGAFLIHLTLGNKYTLSNVNTYLTSYMRKHGSPTATYGNSIWFSTCYSIGQPTSIIIGGYMEQKSSTRLTASIGCLLYCVSIGLTYFSVDLGFSMALLTYGLIPGLGCGLAYMTPMSNGFGWFPQKRGIVAGGILAGLGLGPFIFNMVQTNFVNPLNLSPEPGSNGYFTQPEILDRVPSMFVLMGSIYGIMELIGCSLLFEPPLNHLENCVMMSERPPNQQQSSKVNQRDAEILSSGIISTVLATTDNRETTDRDKLTPIKTTNRPSIINQPPPNHEQLLVKDAVKTREFIILFLSFGLTTQGMLFVNSVLKKYGQTFIMDDNFLAWSGSIGSIANCLGRVFWGLAIDRLSFIACFMATCLIFCLASLLTPFEFILSSKILFMVITVCLFGSLSGWVCIFPVHVSRVFGRKNGSLIYGLVYLAQPIISITMSPSLQYLIDHTNRFIPFYCILGLNLTGLLIYSISSCCALEQARQRDFIQDINGDEDDEDGNGRACRTTRRSDAMELETIN